jgi:hypothetical protein
VRCCHAFVMRSAYIADPAFRLKHPGIGSMFKSWKSCVVASLMASCLLSANSQAQSTILDQTHTVAAADVAVPVEHSVTISAAGTYQVTLVDLGAALSTPAPLLSVKLAITNGDAIVGTPLAQAGSMQFSATAAGTYVLHVIGRPDPSKPGSGPIGIQVTNTADNSQVAQFSDTLALPPAGIPNNQGVLDDSFTVPSAGDYQVTLTDFNFPQSLGTLTLAITQAGGALITTLPTGPMVVNPVTLQPGVTYRIFAIGQAGATVNAGLYGVNVGPVGGGAPVYGKAVPVGAVSLLGAPALTAGSYTLTFTDLNYPNPLSPAGAAVTLNGQVAAQLTASGNQTFTATSSTYQVFALGLPQGAATKGSYWVTLAPQSGAAVLSTARAVSASAGSTSAYSFDTSVITAGTYSLDLADFGLSAPFTSLSVAAFQNGHMLGSALNAAGSMNITPAVGPMTLLVFAQPGTGGSLFGLDVTASGSSTALFAATQGVGELFASHPFTVPSSGSYTVNVSDLQFPAKLATLAVVVTQGANRLGSIYAAGKFNFTGTPGASYFVSFTAQADTTTADHAGTYAISVNPTPPAPVVTLQSSATSVTAGGTVALTWTSQNAASCSGSSTPSGVWSANQLSGTAQQTGSITASTTFTLTCTGDGGSTTKTATVNISSSSGGGGGHSGGGSMSLDALALLALLSMARLVASAGDRKWKLYE